jgi:glycerophosphoryl diester phosphodiesterase
LRAEPPLAIAHRGLFGGPVPENGLAAFAAAVAASVAIECDVRLTADGVPVVFHDATLERMCGRAGRVAELTAAELRAAPLPDGSTVPTLAELLEAVAGAVPLFVEVKGDARAATAAIARTIGAYPGPLAIMGFDPRLAAAFRARVACPLGLVASWAPPAAALARFDFLALRAEAIETLGPRGRTALAARPVLAWTIRTPAQARRVARYAGGLIFEGMPPSFLP